MDHPEQKIKQDEATSKLEVAARELAANFFRIVRGAGEPEHLARKVAAFAEAFNAYSDTFGRPPGGDVLKTMLEYPRDPALNWENQRVDQLLAEETICRSALQFVASGLLDQQVHRKQALNDLRAAISRIAERQNMGVRQRSAAIAARTRGPKSR